METKIADGDYILNSRRCFVTATEFEEILRQVMICLKVKKGNFSFDPNLGNELYSLDLNEISIDMIKAYVCDALNGVKEAKVMSVERLKKQISNTLSLEITIVILDETVKIII